MHPDDEQTDALPALPADTGQEHELPRRADRRSYTLGRFALGGGRAGLLSAIAPLVAMVAVATMWATGTGLFAASAAEVNTASIGVPRVAVPKPTPSPSPTVPEAPAEVAVVTPVPPPPPPPAPPPPPPGPQPYVIAAGDTIDDAATHCGIPWGRVFDANPDVVDPGLVEPGQQLRCPVPEEQLAQRALPEPTPTPTPTPEPVEEEPADEEEEAAAEPEPEEPVEDDAPAVPSGSVWDDLAECESGGDWSINTGNGYYGGLQFSASSWRAVGGSGLPHQHSREEQIHRGEILQDAQGWGAWPTCARKLGLI